jgi:hypothetical protein
MMWKTAWLGLLNVAAIPSRAKARRRGTSPVERQMIRIRPSTRLSMEKEDAHATDAWFDASSAIPGMDWLAFTMRPAGPARGEEDVAIVCSQCRKGAKASARVGNNPRINQKTRPRV